MKIGKKLKAVLFGSGRRIVVTGLLSVATTVGLVSAEKADKLQPAIDAILTVAAAVV